MADCLSIQSFASSFSQLQELHAGGSTLSKLLNLRIEDILAGPALPPRYNNRRSRSPRLLGLDGPLPASPHDKATSGQPAVFMPYGQTKPSRLLGSNFRHLPVIVRSQKDGSGDCYPQPYLIEAPEMRLQNIVSYIQICNQICQSPKSSK